MTLYKKCSWHTPNNYSYIQAHEDAEKRMAKGEVQTLCNICKLYYWSNEIGVNPNTK